MYEAVIIGAGLSGLAAGARLAHFGKKVLVLERHTVWGGLNSFYKKGGYHFDTGLHALTNWVRPGYKGPRTPLVRVARQLRLDLDALALLPQRRSEIVFPGQRLSFSNDFAELAAEVERSFPGQVDGLARLRRSCAEYPDFARARPPVSSRQIVGEYIREPLLGEMLLAPILYYGSAEEDDVDFEQFVILWRSIFEEGFCRPRGGVRPLLDLLRARLEDGGGELRRGVGVERLEVADGRVRRLHLSDGTALAAPVVISSAGLVETTRLRSDRPRDAAARLQGQLSFVESIWVLDRTPAALGHDACISFRSTEPRFFWRRPAEASTLKSTVVCCPGNYLGAPPEEPPVVRLTQLADPAAWIGVDPARYQRQKVEAAAQALALVEGLMPGATGAVRFQDSFTPRTVLHYTGKLNGAVYGSPHKQKSGRTDLANLFLCGTDQGFVGIVGAMLSGITAANSHVLAAEAA